MNARLAAAALSLCAPCWAQAPATGAAPAPRPAASAADSVPQRGGEPQVLRILTEDDAVRVEELRVRGQTRRIVVRSKLPGVPAYEIGPAGDARAPAQERGNEGRSQWQLFSF
jgi:hypothetical protein